LHCVLIAFVALMLLNGHEEGTEPVITNSYRERLSRWLTELGKWLLE